MKPIILPDPGPEVSPRLRSAIVSAVGILRAEMGTVMASDVFSARMIDAVLDALPDMTRVEADDFKIWLEAVGAVISSSLAADRRV